jgi:hypothetical protein
MSEMIMSKTGDKTTMDVICNPRLVRIKGRYSILKLKKKRRRREEEEKRGYKKLRGKKKMFL